MLDDAAIADLKAKHGAVFRVDLDDVTVVVRPPTRVEYKRFRAKVTDEDRRDAAVEELALTCVVHPPRAEFEALLERLPALADTVGGKILKLAGAQKIDDAKKL